MATDLNPPAFTTAATPRYNRLEDAQGLFISTVQCALGIHLLRMAGLVTGGTAGLALVIAYGTGWSFGAVFFVINLPFYGIAWARKGRVFAIKSFVSVAAVSALADAMAPYVTIAHIHPGAAAVLFGVVAGAGLLGLFRHASSLGGVSIIAVIVQDRWGIRAGWVQLGYDACLFVASAFVLEPMQVAWSLLGALVLNGVIAMNHRRDWYVAA